MGNCKFIPTRKMLPSIRNVSFNSIVLIAPPYLGCMRRRITLFIFFLQTGFSLFGADYRFTRLGILQGLSSNSIGAILTDSRGFTWVGTLAGLNRFDGENFTVYNHRRNDSTSIPHDNVLSLAEDDKGMLWVGTQNGIARFNPWNGKAETIKEILPEGEEQVYPPKFVYIDKSNTVWAKSLNAIWKFDERKNVFQLVMRCDGKNNHAANCTYLYEDREGRFWICTYAGLYLYDRKSGNLIQYHVSSEIGKTDLVNCIYEDHEGNLWCGTWGNGIARFFPETGKFATYCWVRHFENPSAVNIVFGITEIASGKNKMLWAATNSGLALITDKNRLDDDHVVFVQNDLANPESISSNQVNCVSGNPSGQLWVGTGDGISILLPEHQLFQGYAPQFKGQTIRILPDGKGGNYFCTWYGNGLQQIDSNGTIVRAWKKIPENNTSPDCGQVSDMLRAKDGTLWVATFGGLSHGDADGNDFNQFLPQPENPNSICDNHITCLAEDRDGKIWCGSYGKGISVLDPRNFAATNYVADKKNNSSLADNLVWCLYCTKNGEVWVGTNDGICRYNKSADKFETWKNMKRENDTINFGLCGELFEDSRGILWIGSDNGLFFRKPDGSFGAYLKDDGLADNGVRGIREDLAGNMWITTVNGLSKLNFKNETFTNYSVGSGLPLPELDGDLANGRNGKLLIGLNDIVVEFNPSQLNLTSVIPSVFITGISVSGNPFPFSKNPSSISGTEFPWNENVISFDFVSPGFRGDPLVKYSYTLMGADEKWINSGTRHFATYGGLQPGNYTFLCRASMSNGAWSNPVSFSFVIHPPFWRTWWFIISVITISVLLIVIIVLREATQKIRRQILILEKQQAVEKERNRISRDMHDDLGSGLTKIAILSEVVKKKMGKENPDASGQKQIDTISESARELVDNLNEIIWALNPENDNLSNLAAYIREYADNYLETSGISFHCTIPENLPALPLSEEKRRNLFLIIKEALHNIVKHAAAKKVDIDFLFENEKIKIEVRDDGKGFDLDSVRRFGNGLKSMNKRADVIGAAINMESKLGEGTAIKIQMSTVH